eukprot:7780836-Pyramimonas_sp.AAC.1
MGGSLGAFRRPHGCLAGASWGPLWASRGPPGGRLGPLERTLGAPGSLSGPSGGRHVWSGPPSGHPLGAVLGASWAVLEASW